MAVYAIGSCSSVNTSGSTTIFQSNTPGRYANEFSGQHNVQPLHTIEQTGVMILGTDGERLEYSILIGPPETRQPRML